MFKRTKIGATIGPSCETYEILKSMAEEGMDYARLNFSHGTYENHRSLLDNIRKVEKNIGRPIAIMQDLQGPKIRIGSMPEKGVGVKAGEQVVFDTAITEYDSADIPLAYSGLEEFVKTGERLLVDDGRMEFKILKISGTKIYAIVVEGGIILPHKGMNFPDTVLTLPALSDKDRGDLRFGIKMGVDVVAISFVHKAEDIIGLRHLIKKIEQEESIVSEQPITIYAKIEKHEAVHNIEEIIEAADGIMIARGDLGLEMPAAEVPLVQKKLIDAANAAAKPVIVATQMLDSMQRNRRPTRAEVSDVANAVIDHADSLLLTNETAVGKYPIQSIKVMTDVIVATEKSRYDDLQIKIRIDGETPVGQAVTELSRVLAEEVKAKIILAASITGETGRLISHVRPELPILVATNSDRVKRQLNLSWGVRPFILPTCHSIEELIERSIDHIKREKIAKKGDKMIIVAGEPVGQAGNVNLVEVRKI